MAIEKVKKATLMIPSEDVDQFLNRLYRLAVLHMTDAFSQFQQYGLHRLGGSLGEGEEPILEKLRTIGATFEKLVDRKADLLEGFFPVPLSVTESEMREILSTCEIEPLYHACRSILEEYSGVEKRIPQIQEEIKTLSHFADLPFPPEDVTQLKKVQVLCGCLPSDQWKALSTDPLAQDLMTWQVLSSMKRDRKVVIACLLEDTGEVIKLLKRYGVREIPLPNITGTISTRIAALQWEREECVRREKALKDQAMTLSPHARRVTALLGYHEAEREKGLSGAHVARSKRVFVVTGYVREREIPLLDEVIRREFAGVSALYRDPTPSEPVPVSIRLHPFFRPVQLLIDMFGLPDYFSFDPTPFITVTFLSFFGICFSDVVYGLCLTGLSYWMMRKFAGHEAMERFFLLFLYAGISTTIFGALMGSWAGDLYAPQYLGENNLLLRLQQTFVVIDPLSKPVIALIAALGIGVINQFYGIALKIYRELKRGERAAAIYDGGLWLITLPGFLVTVTPLFLRIPLWLFRSGMTLFLLGAVGLILTQGRNESTLLAKGVTGVISLYGIVGSYGCMTFVQDILSYSRLLALGLTTSLVALAFNIMANFFKPFGVVGLILFVGALIVGHLFNFFVSIIGSFVHPARLIFLEFFGRFYEGGAERFQPFGFSSKRVQIVK